MLCLTLAVVFAAVGIIFIAAPNAVIAAFNEISYSLDMRQMSISETGFYPILASAYMYIVTLLAFMIYRNPSEKLPAMLLINAKLASAVLSFLLLVISGPYLIFLVNGLTDSAIGIGILIFHRANMRSSKVL